MKPSRHQRVEELRFLAKVATELADQFDELLDTLSDNRVGYPRGAWGNGHGGDTPDPTGTAALVPDHAGMAAAELESILNLLPSLAKDLRHLHEKWLGRLVEIRNPETGQLEKVFVLLAATPRCANTAGCPDNADREPGRSGRCGACAAYYARNFTERRVSRKRVSATDAA